MNQSDSAWIYSITIQLLIQSPVYLTILGGIVTALIRWQKHPRISMLTTASLAISLVAAVTTTILNFILPYYLYRSGGSPSAIGYYYGVTGAVNALINALTLVFLLIAVFSDRSRSTTAIG